MKTANLYATTDVSLVSRRDLQYRAVPVKGYGVIYVRAELVECAPIEALDRVRCLPNENYLNGTPLDEEATAACDNIRAAHGRERA